MISENTPKHEKKFHEHDEIVSINIKSQAKEKEAQPPVQITEIKKRFRFLRFAFKTILYLFIFATVVSVSFSIFAQKNTISEKKQPGWIKKISLVDTFKTLVESADKKLKGEEAGRINILLLGMGGKNHSGGYLTDTIMLASLDPATKKVGMLSIPRDLTVPIEGVGWRKINSINALAENKDPGKGGEAVVQAIGDILNIEIHYYVRVDFQGFIKIVDELGPIQVDVENALDDYKYPIMGREDATPLSSRYEHLHVDKGLQEMDGSLALKFARSRHAYGVEGSDFARAKRQQKIMMAIKEKALSLNMLFKPTAIKNIIEALDEHISTNFEIWEMVKLWENFKDINKDQIINKGLDNSPGGLLVNSVGEGGAYILTPKSGDFSEVQYLVANLLQQAPKETKTQVSEQNVKIEVQNGTWVNGLASKISVDLEKLGFNVVQIGNCSRQNFERSVIYDLTYGQKDSSLQILKEKTGANIGYGIPQWLLDSIEKKKMADPQKYIEPDFLFIAGQDAAKPSTASFNANNLGK